MQEQKIKNIYIFREVNDINEEPIKQERLHTDLAKAKCILFCDHNPLQLSERMRPTIHVDNHI